MSLGFIGDSRAIPKLNELLEDDEPNIIKMIKILLKTIEIKIQQKNLLTQMKLLHQQYF